MTRLRKRMPEELDRRNYSPSTARCYLRTVEDFGRYFHRPPDRLGPAHIRQYQAHLLSARKWKPTPTTPASFRYGTACGGPIATRRTADRFASVSIRSTAMSGNRSLVSGWLLLFRPGTRKFSPHFSPADGRSTREARHYVVALAHRARRRVQVRPHYSRNGALSGARLVLTGLSRTSASPPGEKSGLVPGHTLLVRVRNQASVSGTTSDECGLGAGAVSVLCYRSEQGTKTPRAAVFVQQVGSPK